VNELLSSSGLIENVLICFRHCKQKKAWTTLFALFTNAST